MSTEVTQATLSVNTNTNDRTYIKIFYLVYLIMFFDLQLYDLIHYLVVSRDALKKELKKELEYYFSPEYLANDTTFASHMNAQMYVINILFI